MVNYLFELGYWRMNVNFFKFKYVDVFILCYFNEGLVEGMIKNCLLVLCWWVEKVGKFNIIVKDNVYYGVEFCVFVINVFKVCDLD